MNPDDLKTLLEERLPDCQVTVQGDGRHFDLVLIGPQFEGLRTLKRQQLVYGVLSDEIAEGTVHAVNMKTFTLDEWNAR